MDLGLGERVYVITGGTKGLGRATADALVADGARVVVSSRSQESVDAAVAALGDNARGLPADNADPATADALVKLALDTWGRLDGALISVGGPPGTNPPEATDEQWRDALEAAMPRAKPAGRTARPTPGGGGRGGV